MSMIYSSARAAAAVVDEEAVVAAAVGKAGAAAEELAAVGAVAAVEKAEVLAARMFPLRMGLLGSLDSPHRTIHTSGLTLMSEEIELPAPTSAAHLLEEADQGQHTAAANTMAAVRQLLIAPVPGAP
jgi:hypothetical protein